MFNQHVRVELLDLEDAIFQLSTLDVAHVEMFVSLFVGASLQDRKLLKA